MPKMLSSENGTLVTLFSTKEMFEKEESIQLNKRQKKALEYVNEHKIITNRECRELFPEITSRTVLNDLNDLVDKGLLKKEGKIKNAYYTIPKYFCEIKRMMERVASRDSMLCCQIMRCKITIMIGV